MRAGNEGESNGTSGLVGGKVWGSGCLTSGRRQAAYTWCVFEVIGPL